MENSIDLQEWFGGIDIYIFDQLLKGRFVPRMKVLDAGCGSGRNLVYFFRSGYEVFGVDESEQAILQVRRLAAALAPRLPAENFRVGTVEGIANSGQQPADSLNKDRRESPVNNISDSRSQIQDSKNPPATAGGTDKAVDSDQQTADGQSRSTEGFDVVLSSAVLHFARDEQHWRAMVNAMWSVLKPGGIFFARLASTIGIENQVTLLEGRRYRLPDRSDRFLVDAAMLHDVTAALGGEIIEPIKTTVVENMRAMTTWVIQKSHES